PPRPRARAFAPILGCIPLLGPGSVRALDHTLGSFCWQDSRALERTGEHRDWPWGWSEGAGHMSCFGEAILPFSCTYHRSLLCCFVFPSSSLKLSICLTIGCGSGLEIPSTYERYPRKAFSFFIFH